MTEEEILAAADRIRLRRRGEQRLASIRERANSAASDRYVFALSSRPSRFNPSPDDMRETHVVVVSPDEVVQLADYLTLIRREETKTP